MRLHYARKAYVEAARTLRANLRHAEQTILANPDQGKPAPRPYPEMARRGEAWIEVGSYWIGYTLTRPPVILAVFYKSNDMPNTLSRDDPAA